MNEENKDEKELKDEQKLSLIAEQMVIDDIEKFKRKNPELSKIYELDIKRRTAKEIFKKIDKIFFVRDKREEWLQGSKNNLRILKEEYGI